MMMEGNKCLPTEDDKEMEKRVTWAIVMLKRGWLVWQYFANENWNSMQTSDFIGLEPIFDFGWLGGALQNIMATFVIN